MPRSHPPTPTHLVSTCAPLPLATAWLVAVAEAEEPPPCEGEGDVVGEGEGDGDGDGDGEVGTPSICRRWGRGGVFRREGVLKGTAAWNEREPARGLAPTSAGEGDGEWTGLGDGEGEGLGVGTLSVCDETRQKRHTPAALKSAQSCTSDECKQALPCRARLSQAGRLAHIGALRRRGGGQGGEAQNLGRGQAGRQLGQQGGGRLE